MIEIASKSQDKLCKDPAWLYTITCTHDNKYDWRFPTDQEFNSDYDLLSANQFTWAEEDQPGYILYVIPVRTL
jgi:hypothetical protein